MDCFLGVFLKIGVKAAEQRLGKTGLNILSNIRKGDRIDKE